MAAHTFASHRLPAFSMAKLWLQTACLSMGALLVIGAFNLAVDPFDLRFGPSLNLERITAMRPLDTVLWSEGEFRRISPEIWRQTTMIVVGDSRARQLSVRGNIDRFEPLDTGGYLLNLSIGGATYGEIFGTVREMLPRLPQLKAVVMSVPLERIGVDVRDRAPEVYLMGRQPWRYLLNLRTAAQSVQLLMHPHSLPHSSSDDDEGTLEQLAPKPMISTENLDPWGNVIEGKAADFWKKRIERVRWPLVSQRLREQLIPLAAELRAKDIQLIFFFPPLNPELRQYYFEQLQAEHDRYLQSLAAMGVVQDYVSFRPNNLSYRFVDPMHLEINVADGLLRDVLAHSNLGNSSGNQKSDR